MRRAAFALVLLAQGAAAGALEETAAALVSRVGEALTDPPPAAVLVACDGPVEAATLFCGSLSFRLGAVVPQVVRAATPPPTGEALLDAARGAGADVVVRCRVALAGDELLISAEAVRTRKNFWTGLPAVPGAPLVAVITARAEPELKLLGAPSLAGKLAFRPLGRIEAPVLALAAGHLGTDAAMELAVLTSDEVRVLRLDAGALVPILSRSLSDLPRAARPPRVAAGTLSVARAVGAAAIFARPLAHGRGLVLAPRGPVLHALGETEEAVLCAGQAGALWTRPIPGTLLYGPEITLRGEEAPRQASLPAPVVAAACAPGAPQMAVVLESGAVWLLDGTLSRTPAPVAMAGAAVALGDLDGDGALELVTTRPSLPGEEDRATVWSLAGKALFEGPPSGAPILAAAAGDLTGDGRDDAVLAAVERSGTWISMITTDRMGSPASGASR